MDAMRGHGDHPHPEIGVRAQCLISLLHGPGETEAENVRELAGAQWIVEDLYNEIRGMRLQLIEFCKAMSRPAHK